MNTYKFVFKVAGDAIAEPWSIHKTVIADSLDDAAEKTWKCYTESINRITRYPHEALVAFEPQINPLFSLNGSCNDIPLSETTMLNVFFKKRIEKYKNNKPHWS